MFRTPCPFDFIELPILDNAFSRSTMVLNKPSPALDDLQPEIHPGSIPLPPQGVENTQADGTETARRPRPRPLTRPNGTVSSDNQVPVIASTRAPTGSAAPPAANPHSVGAALQTKSQLQATSDSPTRAGTPPTLGTNEQTTGVATETNSDAGPSRAISSAFEDYDKVIQEDSESINANKSNKTRKTIDEQHDQINTRNEETAAPSTSSAKGKRSYEKKISDKPTAK